MSRAGFNPSGARRMVGKRGLKLKIPANVQDCDLTKHVGPC